MSVPRGGTAADRGPLLLQGPPLKEAQVGERSAGSLEGQAGWEVGAVRSTTKRDAKEGSVFGLHPFSS